ncbi:uncharacterized protein BO96DRAFT_401388 [Aspergillus niger CBS 101883]|uniref:Uncharacterized protein n=2 Tax=Aspergillus niger TaxID=5061 RepID=A2QVB6_ASPNC|nr:uncharacterized protein BO96DRAFT_401388 [Aspergillus niger CBS 101883]XP_059601527.1 hypothetical protein An11g00820 [Aspergillus niger]PYH52635.1 hypothetical protein BO96DRAFT_401388 [Aspergillus niger CBS 101883]CAK40556.1 hypothetical protein An11g00820 [Aspergillus niger]
MTSFGRVLQQLTVRQARSRYRLTGPENAVPLPPYTACQTCSSHGTAACACNIHGIGTTARRIETRDIIRVYGSSKDNRFGVPTFLSPSAGPGRSFTPSPELRAMRYDAQRDLGRLQYAT